MSEDWRSTFANTGDELCLFENVNNSNFKLNPFRVTVRLAYPVNKTKQRHRSICNRTTFLTPPPTTQVKSFFIELLMGGSTFGEHLGNLDGSKWDVRRLIFMHSVPWLFFWNNFAINIHRMAWHLHIVDRYSLFYWIFCEI